MTHNKTNTNIENIKGQLSYDDKVIEKIVGLALEKVPGLLAVNGGFFANLKDKLVNTDTTRDGVNVEVGSKEVAVDLEIIAEYQVHIPQIFASIKEAVESEIKKMTDLDVIEVNVKVIDIKTREQHEGDSVSLQDKVSQAAEATGEFASGQVGNVKSAVETGSEKIKDLKPEPRVK